MNTQMQCCLCKSIRLILLKKSNFKNTLTSSDFAITDNRYGLVHDIYKCQNCNLIQCPNIKNVEKFYKDLKDVNYLLSSKPRELQFKEIIKFILRFKNKGNFLDVGAGTGILVAEAQNYFESEGVEPSKWMCEIATNKNLNVHNYIINKHNNKIKYDVITLIDVLEHVNDPLSLLKEISKRLNDDGVGFIVTPDVSSFAARLMGWRWWHFRLAHITYFDIDTLDKMLKIAGLQRVHSNYASWYFSLSYLFHRLGQYFPFLKYVKIPKIISKKIIKLNLFDSRMIVTKKIKN